MSEGPARADVATCPEHLLSPALGSCERCGRFVCEACAAAREPLRCAACLIIEERTTTLGALPFTFGSALSQGLGFFWRNLPVLAGLALIFAIPEGLIEPHLSKAARYVSILPDVALSTVWLLTLHRRESGAPRANLGASFVDGFRLWPRVIGVSLVIYVEILAFCLLLIVPGIMRAAAYQVLLPCILFEGLGFAARRRTKTLTQGHRWPIFGLALIEFAPFRATRWLDTHFSSSLLHQISLPHSMTSPILTCAWRAIHLLIMGFGDALDLAIFVGLLAHERAEKEPPAVT